MERRKNKSSRRNFFKYFVAGGLSAVTGDRLLSATFFRKEESDEEKVAALLPNGKMVKISKHAIGDEMDHKEPVSRKEARKGIFGKKFVLIVDLAKCRNARKCVEACEKHHYLPADRPYIKVLKMKDNPRGAHYWMPKKCFQCGNPPCVKVCPVGATYKRTDNIVLIDNERCIGCRFCMAACPYSARVFNWDEPEKPEEYNHHYSPETSVPSKIGTVEKCDFCPDMLRMGKLPPCITECPNGVLYFGDANEDTVTNGTDTVRLSELLKDKAGYRYMEELGTEPNVYYLPPVDRLFPFEDENEDEQA